MSYINYLQDHDLANKLLDDTLQHFYSPHAGHALRNPILFGDFRNALNKNESRWYEDLLDFEAVFFLFQEVQIFLIIYVISIFLNIIFKKKMYKI